MTCFEGLVYIPLHYDALWNLGSHLRLPLAIVTVLSACCLTACSWQQAYNAAQGWQRNTCLKILDAQERERCMASTSMSYDDYKRQTETATSAK